MKTKVSETMRMTYKKGNVVNKLEVQKAINDNFEKLIIELVEVAKYSDGTEEMVVRLKFPK